MLFLSALRPSQIHSRGLAVKRKQRWTGQCLLLQIAKREHRVQIDFIGRNELLRRGLAPSLALLAEQLVHMVPEVLIQLLLVDCASSDGKDLRIRSFHAAQCIQRVTSGPTHRSPPSDSLDRVRCDANIPF